MHGTCAHQHDYIPSSFKPAKTREGCGQCILSLLPGGSYPTYVHAATPPGFSLRSGHGRSLLAGQDTMAAARPLVSVIGVDSGAAAEQTALPAVFTAPIR